MPYEVEIRCDIRKGDPLNKQRCHSDAQARKPALVYAAATSRDAVYAVELEAKNAGWVRLRGAARPNRWVCPVCQTQGGYV